MARQHRSFRALASSLRPWVKQLVILLFAPAFILGALVVIFSRRQDTPAQAKPRLFFGSVPIISNSYWAKAMRKAGYPAEAFVTDYYSVINRRDDWDRVLSEQYSRWPSRLWPYLGFLYVLRHFDMVFVSCQGLFIGATPLWRLQAWLLHLAGQKIVVLPYGADSYVYRNVRSTALLHGLLASYPEAARRQDEIQAQVDYWVKHADVFIPGVMNPDGYGRWDVLVPSHIFLDTEIWHRRSGLGDGDGRNGRVLVCHAPNHRGFKGTEFVIDAVKRLQEEGLKVELRLVERMQNTEVRRILTEEADILVEQLICTGHGLNGLEGLSSGLPVVCNLEDEAYVGPWRRWSYFGECPIVSAAPENLIDVLRKLVTRPELRRQLGEASRQYATKYHDLAAGVFLFEAVIAYAYGQRDSLINLYHPLSGERSQSEPKVVHPLVRNRIID